MQLRTTSFVVLAVVLAISPAVTRGQSGPAGSLTGVVQDSTGSVLPGVSVTVKHLGTGFTREVITEDVGRWTAQALPVGTYEVSFDLPGFKRLIKDGVTVEAAVGRTVDEIGRASCRERGRGW